MHKRPLSERILYKYEFVEQVEKEGSVYKKYKKVRRFPFLSRTNKIIFYLLFFMFAFVLIVFFSQATSWRK